MSNKPIKSDGTSSSYYDIDLPEWLVEKLIDRAASGHCFIKTEELNEIFGNDFNRGTLFKSFVRAFKITLGCGKAGNDMRYEVNKIKYYADKMLEVHEREQGGDHG